MITSYDDVRLAIAKSATYSHFVSHNMKKSIYILTIIMNAVIATGQELNVPKNYSIVDSISGDLDGDSISELVVIYNTISDAEEQSVPRELIIYKLKNNKKWRQWKCSKQALYGSKDGGMMGDPFGELLIENDNLLISHFGGTSWKWGFTDKYGLIDDEFYLIGYTSNAGKLCEYWQNVDFDILSGEISITKEYEKCEEGEQHINNIENERFNQKGVQITMQGRQERELKITSPKYGHEIYIAIGRD